MPTATGSFEVKRWNEAPYGEFDGLQRVAGVIGDRKGSFVLETVGDFDGAEARWTATVIRGSGLGDLEDLTGSGSFRAPHGSTAEYELG